MNRLIGSQIFAISTIVFGLSALTGCKTSSQETQAATQARPGTSDFRGICGYGDAKKHTPELDQRADFNPQPPSRLIWACKVTSTEDPSRRNNLGMIDICVLQADNLSPKLRVEQFRTQYEGRLRTFDTNVLSFPKDLKVENTGDRLEITRNSQKGLRRIGAKGEFVLDKRTGNGHLKSSLRDVGDGGFGVVDIKRHDTFNCKKVGQ